MCFLKSRLHILGCLAYAGAVVLVPLAHAASRNETALDRYVVKPDQAYEYKLLKTAQQSGGTVFILEMTSQKYLTTKEVDRPVWKHWLTIAHPKTVHYQTALLLIGGGSNDKPAPDKAPEEVLRIAKVTGSVVAELKMVPNQPLRFTDEDRRRVEDELIAYTWDKFLRTGDEKWPARLPMTKSAVRAMDTVTDFLSKPEVGRITVDQFVVAGGSKRGWTTWSTAAVDRRVVAIAPIVIDMLNVVPSFKHHYRAYGFYAPAVGDYVDMGIMDWQDTSEYKTLMKIEEPYEYRDRLTMPKFLINACGDQFFLPDSWKFYYNNLLGEKHLRYVPNVGHSLDGSDVIFSLAAFYSAILNRKKLPEYDWEISEDGSIRVQTRTRPREVKLWQCTNLEARDFRIETTGKSWTSAPLRRQKGGVYVGCVPVPEKGWTAFMVEMTYPGKPRERAFRRKGGVRLGEHSQATSIPFKFTTGVHVLPEDLPFEFVPGKPPN